jgi:hypothetical protein
MKIANQAFFFLIRRKSLLWLVVLYVSVHYQGMKAKYIKEGACGRVAAHLMAAGKQKRDR